MIGNSVSAGHVGLGMGVYGTLKNLGKVAGPLAAGVLLEYLPYDGLFRVLAGGALLAAVLVLLAHRQSRRVAEQRP